MNRQTKLIAIIGGSGAGKTWLADRLHSVLGSVTARLSLDDFYHDRSSLPLAERAKINFDHPDTIDWPLFEDAIRDCRAGRSTWVPQYDFTTHKRLPAAKHFIPAPLVLVEGLWLLWQPRVHELFDLKIYLECPEQLRLARRLARDMSERDRSESSIRSQFQENVVPMHNRFVAPQVKWANLILQAPLRETGFRNLVQILENEFLHPVPITNKPARKATDSSFFAGFDELTAKTNCGPTNFADGIPFSTVRTTKPRNSRDGLTKSDLP